MSEVFNEAGQSAYERRCRKPGCGALRIIGSPCTDYDCPQRWVAAEDYRAALASARSAPEAVGWRPIGLSTPEGEWLQTWRSGEDRSAVSMLRRWPEGEEDEWIAPDGRTTVTHKTYAAPTHYFAAPPPPASPSPGHTGGGTMSDSDAYVLVPREPTDEMIDAFRDASFRHFDVGYAAMLAAAPEPVAPAPDTADVAAKDKRIAELEEGLRPFDEVCAEMLEGVEDYPDSKPAIVTCGRSTAYLPLTLGDLRRASALLSSQEPSDAES